MILFLCGAFIFLLGPFLAFRKDCKAQDKENAKLMEVKAYDRYYANLARNRLLPKKPSEPSDCS